MYYNVKLYIKFLLLKYNLFKMERSNVLKMDFILFFLIYFISISFKVNEYSRGSKCSLFALRLCVRRWTAWSCFILSCRPTHSSVCPRFLLSSPSTRIPGRRKRRRRTWRSRTAGGNCWMTPRYRDTDWSSIMGHNPMGRYTTIPICWSLEQTHVHNQSITISFDPLTNCI